MIKRYVWNLLIAFDQLLNAVLAGDPDETLSSRCGKLVATCKVCRALCRFMDRIDYRHCAESVETDEGKDAVL